MTTEKTKLQHLLLDMLDGERIQTVYTGLGEVTSTQDVGMALLKQINEGRANNNLPTFDFCEWDFDFTWLLASHVLGHLNFRLRGNTHGASKLEGSVLCRFTPTKIDNKYVLIVEEDDGESISAIEGKTIDSESIEPAKVNASVQDEITRLTAENAKLRESYLQLQSASHDVSQLLTGPNFNIIINGGENVSEEAAQALQKYITGVISSVVVENAEGGLELNTEAVKDIPAESKIIINTISVVKPYLTAVSQDKITALTTDAVAKLDLVNKVLEKMGLRGFTDSNEITPAGVAIAEFVGIVTAIVARIVTIGLNVALLENEPTAEEPA